MLRKVLTSRRRSGIDHQARQISKVNKTTAEQSSALICQLPVEIFLAITVQLNNVSRWCLASTCRALYRLVARCHPLSVKNREYYFTRRQLTQYWKLCIRDLPDYLVCNVHTELYLWRSQHQVGFQCPKSAKVGRYDPATPHLCYPPLKGYRRWHNGLYITEFLRDLILRYHLRGPEWGLPVSVLSHTCKGPISPTIYERKAVEGKLVNDRLMVKTLTSHTTEIRRFKYWPVRAEVYQAAVCPHSSKEVWLVFKAAMEHLITAQGLREADFDGRGICKPSTKNLGFEKRWYRCSMLLKCLWCATDVRISFRRTRLREMEITFATYHDFGGFSRDLFQNGMFKEIRDRPYYVRPPVEEWGERLRFSLEDLYGGIPESLSPNMETTRPGNSFIRDTDVIAPSISNVTTLSSKFIYSRCTCHGLEWAPGIEAWPVALICADHFIGNSDALQFELQF